MTDAKKPKATAKSKTTAKRKPATAKPKAAKRKAAAKPAKAKVAAKTTRKKLAKAAPPKGKAQKKVREEVDNFKDKAADKARDAAERGKDKATEAVGGLGKMIRDSASAIDENVGSEYGDYVRGAADAVEDFADKVDAKKVDDIVGDARDFVRKSPALAIGAAAAVGFLISRLVRSGRDDA